MGRKKPFLAQSLVKSQVWMIASVVICAAVVYFAFSLYSSAPLLSPAENPSDLKSFYLIGLVTSILAVLAIQVVFFLSVKKMVETLATANQEILGNLSSLEQHKSDEIKELVTTRNMLLMKMNNKKGNVKT
jgi:hypothetical protein